MSFILWWRRLKLFLGLPTQFTYYHIREKFDMLRQYKQMVDTFSELCYELSTMENDDRVKEKLLNIKFNAEKTYFSNIRDFDIMPKEAYLNKKQDLHVRKQYFNLHKTIIFNMRILSKEMEHVGFRRNS